MSFVVVITSRINFFELVPETLISMMELVTCKELMTYLLYPLPVYHVVNPGYRTYGFVQPSDLLDDFIIT